MIPAHDLRNSLKSCLGGQEGFVELRYHSRSTRSMTVEQGKLERSMLRHREGVGVRVLESGSFGFASCGSVEPRAVMAAIDRARGAARKIASFRREKIEGLAPTELAVGHFELPGVDEVLGRSLAEKIAMAQRIEGSTRAASAKISTAICAYNEIEENKVVVTTDGADCSSRLIRPEFRISAVAEAHAERQVSNQTVGVTGNWDCLFHHRSAEKMAEDAAKTAVDLLSAKTPNGGRKTVILAPSIVGLLVHEAIGHTVEADFVQSGSVAAGRLGTRVGSELVTLCDSGLSEHGDGAGGSLPVDDEGVPAQRTVIIENGILKSYLHDRETAARFGTTPTGSARAWEYSDPPLIRMRNTYLEPGEQSLEEIIASTPDGLLVDGPRNGQADATGEFMFGVERAYVIRDGKIGEMMRGVTISGIAFDVLATVDAVSKEFRWDLGAGYCGKGQPAKVDAGGPYIRCQLLLGGQQ